MIISHQKFLNKKAEVNQIIIFFRSSSLMKNRIIFHLILLIYFFKNISTLLNEFIKIKSLILYFQFKNIRKKVLTIEN